MNWSLNALVFKRAVMFSLIFGALLGLIALIPQVIGYVGCVLIFLSSVCVILYMKKNEKHLGIIDTQQGAILGAVIGFFSTVGFFITFSPMVCILKMIFKNYYAYAIPDMFTTGMWLFFIIVFMVALIFSMINSVSAMGLAWLLEFVEKKPEELSENTNLDIKIDD